LPRGARLGKNENAFVGGFRLWEDRQQPELNKAGKSGTLFAVRAAD